MIPYVEQVIKEDHDVLSWIFSRTSYPDIIKDHMNGKVLSVPERGEFLVEWHLAGDLKSLKCMFNVSHGANSKHPCLYCMKSSNDISRNTSVSRDIEDPNWKPVLPIPLQNVHICTLHGEVRIIEKLIYLHILFAWNTKPESASKQAIARLEEVLSKAGLHKGHVKIQKDEKLSGKTGNVPNKPSIGGVKARRFLSNHSKESSKIQYSVWKDVISATEDFEDKGTTRVKKVEVWKKLDNMIEVLRKDTISYADALLLEKTAIEFVDAVRVAWGSDHITHYMVRYI